MAYVREGLAAYCREYIDPKLRSPFIQFDPILYFLGLNKPDNRSKLGRPKTGLVMGGALNRIGQGTVEELAHSDKHQFTYQKYEPDGATTVEAGGATATSADFAEDNAGTAETRWTFHNIGVKVRKDSLEAARSESQIMSIMDTAVQPKWERFYKSIHTSIWGGTLTSAQQDKAVWPDYIGLTQWLTANNTCARVDRSVETTLNPVVLAAGTDFTGTVPTVNINRIVNMRNNLASKSPNGQGATLFVTTPSLWEVIADDADAKGINSNKGVQEHSETGFKFPVVEHDNAFYVASPNCPSGEMYCLNPDTLLFEIYSGYNFQWTDFVDKSATEEGGERYEWARLELKSRLTMREPWLNCRITGLTTS